MIGSSVEGGVQRITLDRPEKRNALTPGMLHDVTALAEAHDREAPGVRAILLTGAGESFCAGFDLSLCREDRGAMAELLRGLSLAIRALRRAPVPVVCAAHGAAIAGGCALLGGADVVVTHADATFGYPVVRLGVSPAVSAPMFRQAVGAGGARRRMLDPSLFTGAEALAEGLAHEVAADADAALARAGEIAEAMAAKPPHALRVTKRWLNEIDGSNDDAAMDAALAESLALAGGAEERKRLEAMWRKS